MGVQQERPERCQVNIRSSQGLTVEKASSSVRALTIPHFEDAEK